MATGGLGVEIELKGWDRVRNNLRRLASEYRDEMGDIIRDHAVGEAEHLTDKPYPPERPGQEYTRTYELAEAWVARRYSPSDWAVVNESDHAYWTVRPEKPWMHAGRWWTARDVIQERAGRLTKRLTEALVKLAGGD